jgi:TPR repeat protein
MLDRGFRAWLVLAVVCVTATAAPRPAAAGPPQAGDLDAIRSAAENGDTAAMVELGLRRQKGHGPGRDDGEAVQWFRKAAAADNEEAMYRLGISYANGRGVSLDASKAVEWYRKAADHGHAEAMFLLALAYWSGRGVGQDLVEAHKWLSLSAMYGSPVNRERSTLSRDSLARSRAMTPKLVAEAQKRALDWKADFERRLKLRHPV